MNTMPHHCAGTMFENSNRKFCASLAQLKQEHSSLRERMNQFSIAASNIGSDAGVSDWMPQLKELCEQIVAFCDELDPHSLREEDYLFEVMAKYIGREVGPIAVMEYEHERAKQNLKFFKEAMEHLSIAEAPVKNEEAMRVAAYAIQAYHILSDHFMKEENVLFPMAEQMLTQQEKEELERKFQLNH